MIPIYRHNAPPLELVHQARDALHTAASTAPGSAQGHDLVAYGSALTGTVAALGWLTTSLVDQIRSDLRDHETRPSSRQREREEALTHLTDLEHNLCLGLQDANAYWGSVAETVDPK